MRPYLIAANSSWYLKHYRSSLIKEVKRYWRHQIALCPLDPSSIELEKLLLFIPWKTNRSKDSDFFNLLISLIRVTFLIRALKPSLIHSHTLKANFLISIATSIYSTRTVLSFAGLGQFYRSKGYRKIIFELIIKFILFSSKIERNKGFTWRINNKRTKFIFQNPRDKYLIEKFLPEYRKSNSYLIEGSGIPKKYFRNISKNIVHKKGKISFIFCGRLLKSKGIEIFIKLAKIYKQDDFIIYGGVDPSRNDSLSNKDIKKYENIKNVQFRGNVKDPLLEKNIYEKVLIIPSVYGEGLPRSIGEALALNINVIASKKACCQIFNEEMIYVVQENSLNLYKETINLLKAEILSSKANSKKTKGFEFAKNFLSEEIINDKTINVYKDLLEIDN